MTAATGAPFGRLHRLRRLHPQRGLHVELVPTRAVHHNLARRRQRREPQRPLRRRRSSSPRSSPEVPGYRRPTTGQRGTLTICGSWSSTLSTTRRPMQPYSVWVRRAQRWGRGRAGPGRPRSTFLSMPAVATILLRHGRPGVQLVPWENSCCAGDLVAKSGATAGSAARRPHTDPAELRRPRARFWRPCTSFRASTTESPIASIDATFSPVSAPGSSSIERDRLHDRTSSTSLSSLSGGSSVSSTAVVSFCRDPPHATATPSINPAAS